MPDWGIVPQGFRVKRYVDIFADMASRARSNFGDQIVTDTNKPLGKFLDIISWQLAELWEELEETYNAIAIDTAEGVELDRLVKYKGLKRETEQIATSNALQVAGAENTLVPIDFIVAKENGITYRTLEAVTIPAAGSITVNIICDFAGTRGNAEIGEVNTIITPITGITAVTNIRPIINGQDYETDAALRERYLRTVGGLSTVEAIRAAVAALDGVISNIVLENTTMQTNDIGMPPKSVQVFVYGGDDQIIAQAILDSKAAGIQAYGTTTVTVQDINGFGHDIGFTHAEVVNIDVKITIHKNQFFPAGGEETLKELIVMYIGGEGADGTIYPGLKIGDPVINSYVESLVWTVGGITDVSAEIKRSTDASFSTDNIVIGQYEIARVELSDIEVITA